MVYKNPNGRHEYYLRNKEKINEYSRNYYLKHKDKIKDNSKAYQYELIKKLRPQVLDLLGAKCKECGINDERVLQVDHIHGGGLQERKKIGTIGIYKRILNGMASEYQLLCANCNWIKGSNKQEREKINGQL